MKQAKRKLSKEKKRKCCKSLGSRLRNNIHSY